MVDPRFSFLSYSNPKNEFQINKKKLHIMIFLQNSSKNCFLLRLE